MKDKEKRLLEAILAIIPQQELEKLDVNFGYQEVMKIINHEFEQLGKEIRRLSILMKSGVIEKAKQISKRGGNGMNKNKLVATTEEEKKILEQAKEAIFLSKDTDIKLEKFDNLTNAMHDIPPQSRENILKNSLAVMFNGKAITALAKARTRGEIDELTKTIKIDGVNIFSPDSVQKLGVGTAKIFRYAISEFTKRNHQNATDAEMKYSVFLDVKDFMEANGVDTESESAKKNFRFKLRKNLEALRQAGATFEEKIKGKIKSFGGLNYIGKYEMKRDTLQIEFTVSMANYLTQLPLNQYHRALYSLDDQEDYNAFAIGEAMCMHYSQDNNVIRKTEGKLKVETLLKSCSYPTWEKLKENKWSWEDKVKEPFDKALEKLIQIGFLKDRKYQYPGGIDIPDEKFQAGEIDSYEKFISLLVRFEINDFQDSKTRTAEIVKKKQEQIKKLQAKRKNRTKKDDNQF